MFFLLLALILAIGAWFRIEGLSSRGLEYDEIWTFQHYASQETEVIFSDLALPNNHPLHSLLMKWAVAIGGVSFVSIRFPALLAGLLSTALVSLLALMVWRNRATALLATTFCVSNGGLIHYSQTARGYSIQTMLILLVASGIVLIEQNRMKWSGKAKAMMATGICVSAILSVLTLPTSILFLAPLFGLHGLFLFRQHTGCRKSGDITKPRRQCLDVLVAYAIFGSFCLFWYMKNRHQFAIGSSQFGTMLSSFQNWLGFCQTTLWKLCGPWLLLALIGLPLTRNGNRYIFSLTCIVGLPLLATVATSAGPARVYLPLTPFIAIAAAGGIVGMLRKLPLPPRWAIIGGMAFGLAALASAPASTREWTPMDWRKVYPAIRSAFSSNAYLCFPAGEGYPLQFNNFPAAIVDTLISTPTDDSTLFVQIGSSNRISGIDPITGGEKSISANAIAHTVMVSDMPCSSYRLVKLPPGQVPAPGKTVLLSIPASRTDVVEGVAEAFQLRHPGQWIGLNGFLYRTPWQQQGKSISARLLASEDFPLNADDVKRIGIFTECKILLYVVEDGTQEAAIQPTNSTTSPSPPYS